MRSRGSIGPAPGETVERPSSSQSNAIHTHSSLPARQHVGPVRSRHSSPIPSANSSEDLASRPLRPSTPFYATSIYRSHGEQAPRTPTTGRARKSYVYPDGRASQYTRHVGTSGSTYSFSESRPPPISRSTQVEVREVDLSKDTEDTYGVLLRRGSQLSQAASIEMDEIDDSGLGYNSSDADSEQSNGKLGGDLLASGEGMLVPHGSTLRAKKKRTRTLPTTHQSSELNKLLAETPFPSTARREELGRRIGLSARKVQVWFQNRRQKARRAKHEVSGGHGTLLHEREEEDSQDTTDDRRNRPSSSSYAHSSAPSRPSRHHEDEIFHATSLNSTHRGAYPFESTSVDMHYENRGQTPPGIRSNERRPATSKSNESGARGWTSSTSSSDFRSYTALHAREWASSLHTEGTSQRDTFVRTDDDKGTRWDVDPGSRSVRAAQTSESTALSGSWRPTSPNFTEEELKLPPIFLPSSPDPSSTPTKREEIDLPVGSLSSSDIGPTTSETLGSYPPPFTLQPVPIWDNPVMPATFASASSSRTPDPLSSPFQGPSRSHSTHGDNWHLTRSRGQWEASDWRRPSH